MPRAQKMREKPLTPEQRQFLDALFRENFRRLELHAYSILHNWTDAHWAAQDTFHIACEQADELMAHPNPQGWLMWTVGNVSNNRVRLRSIQLKTFLSLNELSASRDEAYRDPLPGGPLLEYAGILTAEEYWLLQAVVIEREPYLDASKQLGITMWSCYKRVERALDKIREASGVPKNAGKPKKAKGAEKPRKRR